MKIHKFIRAWKIIGLATWVASGFSAFGQKNVLQPGDPVIASSANSPGSEGVANAIDGTQAKYLNRDSATPAALPSGFVVTPSVGVTWVTGLAMQSANDAPDRDPKSITLEGSNDETASGFSGGNWELIYKNDAVPAYTSRFETKTFTFENFKAYKRYRWTVLATAGPSSCCMQIAEVQILGTALPKNVVQPGDKTIASSANSPGSEGVANAIDGTQSKYLNRDSATPAVLPSGFIVSPSVGATLINGLAMQSANDAPDRDPATVTLEGSNDDTVSDFTGGTWSLIYRNDAVPAFTARFQTQTFLFNNFQPYKHYRWTVLRTAGPSSCCMQIAEVQFLGSGAPKNVIQPGDKVVASSANSPGSEGVANAIDGTQAKYLNRDSATPAALPSGFAVTPSVGATTVIGLSMQSANDAPDRDPKSVSLEGSNDDAVTGFGSGNWELVYKNDAVPAYAARFQTQTFYFNNTKSYKHYRWTVLATAGPSSCCMQIAEVGLLAVTASVDCSKSAFVLQPVDTPALEGTPATFYAGVNGPWPVQWFANGKAIPGATDLSYTTAPVTPSSTTNVYTVQIVGCQVSNPVRASIFKPSSTKSIGLQFWGSGANGAGPQGNTGPVPNFLVQDNIAGVHSQAYWNVATNASGMTGDGTTLPDSLTDSDGNDSTITFEFTTSGTWGAGTGLETPTQKLLNGIAGTGGLDTEQTMTFRNVPPGKHSLLVYCVNAPLNFHTVKYTVGNQSYFIRVMNSDEYKPAPGFYRGTSTSASNPSIANFVRFDNVEPVNGEVVLSFTKVAAGGQNNNTGVNSLQLLLSAPDVGAPPSVTQDPSPSVGPANGTVRLTVKATGNNITYQWRKNGRSLPDGGHISGATTDTLIISPLGAEDVAVYSVAVFNPAGSVVSKNATVNVSKYKIDDALVGYWKLDSTGGTVAANSATGGQAGKVEGTANWTKGQVGNALSFDGSSTYVLVPNYPKATKALSVSGWVNVAAGAVSPIAFVRNASGNLAVGPADQGASLASQFELGLDAEGFLFAGTVGGPNITTVAAPAVFPLGGWRHVAFTADGAQLRLYIDGVEVANKSYLSDFNIPVVQELSFGGRLSLDTSEPPVLGLDGTTPSNMSGQLDDFGLWNRVLTAEEVLLINTAGKAGNPLSSVVITPPTASPTLAVARTAAGLTVTYTGTLESAPSVTGPYTDVSGAMSPFSATASDPARYYRSRQ